MRNLTRKDILPLVCKYNGLTERAMLKIQSENPLRLEDMIKSFLCSKLSIKTSDLIELYSKNVDLSNLSDIVNLSMALDRLTSKETIYDSLQRLFQPKDYEELYQKVKDEFCYYSNGKNIIVHCELSKTKNATLRVGVVDYRVLLTDAFYDDVVIEEKLICLLDLNTLKLKTVEQIIDECFVFLKTFDIKKHPILAKKKNSFRMEWDETHDAIVAKPIHGNEHNVYVKVGTLDSLVFFDEFNSDSLPTVSRILELAEKYLPSDYQAYKSFVNRFNINDEDADNEDEINESFEFKMCMYERICEVVCPCINTVGLLINIATMSKEKKKLELLGVPETFIFEDEEFDGKYGFDIEVSLLPNRMYKIDKIDYK